MHFEAESNGNHYEVNVNETKQFWKVSFKEEGKDWVHYKLPKESYQILDETISFLFNQSSYLIDVVKEEDEYTVYTRGSHRSIKIYNDQTLLHQSLKGHSSMGEDDRVTAGMPGKIVQVFVQEGDEVKKDEPVLIMEAMKMENEIRATHDAKIKEVKVSAGENVESGAELIIYE